MVAGWVLLLVSLGYVALLFAVAHHGDRRPLYPERAWLRPIVYSLALAVYCSSWTFYGAVGSAVTGGLAYLPIYLGPILLFALFPGLLRRLLRVAQQHNITSIADFLGSRYGKSQGLAALATIIAVIAAIPYIALQFKAGAMSIALRGGGGGAAAPPVLADSALWLAMLLAVFAILFGTRDIDASEHHHGLMLAVALESLVKLAAFVAVGVFAWRLLPQGLDPAPLLAVPEGALLPPGFVAQTALALLAMFCLPRQFQVAVVECGNPRDLEVARWAFPGYLVLVSVMVLPIALAGRALFAGTGAAPDGYVLSLPLAHGHTGLALFAYLGGFSAATGMVIVASVALATMVSNDLVMPALLRWRAFRVEAEDRLARRVLLIRRATIVLLSLAAFAYYRLTDGERALASMGLLAFAAVAQFAPAIVGGLYWRGASRIGAIGGLTAGFAVWTYTLLLPTLLPGAWVQEGPIGLHPLRPEALFGLRGWNAITHGTFWSLLVNTATFLLLSLRFRPSVDERLHALPFLDPWRERGGEGEDWRGRVTVGELRTLSARIVGERATMRAFEEYAAASGKTLAAGEPAGRGLLQFTERLLAGAIGGSSARRVLTTALRGTGLDLGEVVSLLDEASQQARFNRDLLGSTLEHVSQGISVVDAEMRLVAWNRRYLELFDYPAGMVYVGRPVADLIRFNAERGECGPGEVDAHVEKRLRYMRDGSEHVFERVRSDGTVIETRGRSMPGGGFVTTYTDVTAYKQAERALLEAKATLEERVEERTTALSTALAAQQRAKQDAESANLSKTRFLAAASHDLLQPLNAARLFASALIEHPAADQEARRLAGRIDAALLGAEELLDGLLDVSRLDSGTLRPEPRPLRADVLLQSLREQFAALAAARGLALRVHARPMAVLSDRVLLRRILQNLVANALRYTRAGGVLLALRQRGDMLELQVWDTGPGIQREHAELVFEEFQRLDRPSPWGDKGLGLGLSICRRMAGLLGHPLQLRSTPGRGSVFSVTVPLLPLEAVERQSPPPSPATALPALHVLCVDNDAVILEGMEVLLGRWGISVDRALGLEQALGATHARRPDLLLVDLQLGEALDGLAVIEILRRATGGAPAALVTADGSEDLARRARDCGVPLLRKPVKPAALRALVAAVAARRPLPAPLPT